MAADDATRKACCPLCSHRFQLGALMGAVYCPRCGRRFHPGGNLDETVILSGKPPEPAANADGPDRPVVGSVLEDTDRVPDVSGSSAPPAPQKRGRPTAELSGEDTVPVPDGVGPEAAPRREPEKKRRSTSRIWGFVGRRQMPKAARSDAPAGHGVKNGRHIPAPPPKKRDDEDGEPFGDYDLLEEIARGGMGVVYRARQRGLRRIVALKQLRAGDSASEEERERLLREAKASASLTHPNIVPIHEFSSWQGRPYYTMDFIDGDALDRVIERGPMQPNEACELIETVARAIHYAHTRGIIHRDIKPANIIIDRAGRPLVTDFGLAVDLGESADHDRITRRGAVMGTIPYIPPEQAQGHIDRIDARSDVYALGAVLYELVTGRPPIQGETQFELLRRVIHQEPPAPRTLNPRLHRDVETICLRCLDKNPQKRYQTAEDLADDCRAFLRGEIIQARPVGRLYRLWRLALRRWPVTALVLLAPLLVATLLLVARLSRENRVASRVHNQEMEQKAAEFARDIEKTTRLVQRAWREEYATAFDARFRHSTSREEARATDAAWIDPGAAKLDPADGGSLTLSGPERPTVDLYRMMPPKSLDDWEDDQPRDHSKEFPPTAAPATGAAERAPTDTPTPATATVNASVAGGGGGANGRGEAGASASGSEGGLASEARPSWRWLPPAVFGLPLPFPQDFRLRLKVRVPARQSGELFLYIDTDRDFGPENAHTVLRLGSSRHPGGEFRRGTVELASDRGFAWAPASVSTLVVERQDGKLKAFLDDRWTLDPQGDGATGGGAGTGYLAIAVGDGELVLEELSVEIMGLSPSVAQSTLELAHRFAAQGEYALAAQLYERVSLENIDPAIRLGAVRECVRSLVLGLAPERRNPDTVREAVDTLVGRWHDGGRYLAGEREYLRGLACATLGSPEGYNAALAEFDAALEVARAGPANLEFGGWRVVGPFFDPGAPHLLLKPLPPEENPNRSAYVTAWQTHSWRPVGSPERPDEMLSFKAEDGADGAALDGAVFYAKRAFKAGKTMAVRLCAKTSDGVAVWLNGERLLVRESAGGAQTSLEATALLPAGDNLLLAKLHQEGGSLRARISLEVDEDREAGLYGQLARMAGAAVLIRLERPEEARDRFVALRREGTLRALMNEDMGEIVRGVSQVLVEAIDALAAAPEGDLTLAEEFAETMIELSGDPRQCAQRFRALGRAWYRRGHPDKGADLFERARALSPAWDALWLEEAAILASLGTTEGQMRAEARLEEARQRFPQSVAVHMAQAMFYLEEIPDSPGRCRDAERARRVALVAVSLSEGRQAPPLVLAGRASLMAGDARQALIFASEAISLEESEDALRLREAARERLAAAGAGEVVNDIGAINGINGINGVNGADAIGGVNGQSAPPVDAPRNGDFGPRVVNPETREDTPPPASPFPRRRPGAGR